MVCIQRTQYTKNFIKSRNLCAFLKHALVMRNAHSVNLVHSARADFILHRNLDYSRFK